MSNSASYANNADQVLHTLLQVRMDGIRVFAPFALKRRLEHFPGIGIDQAGIYRYRTFKLFSHIQPRTVRRADQRPKDPKASFLLAG